MSRLVEFFEGENQRLSMTRLLSFMSYFPASYVVVTSPSEGMTGWYLGAFAGAYAAGKAADALQNRQRSPTVNAAGPSTVNITAKVKK